MTKLGERVQEMVEALIDVLIERMRPEIHHALEAQPQRPALLTIELLGHELQCSRATVNRLRTLGMPQVMVGDSPRFVLEDVLVWLAARPCCKGCGRLLTDTVVGGRCEECQP